MAGGETSRTLSLKFEGFNVPFTELSSAAGVGEEGLDWQPWCEGVGVKCLAGRVEGGGLGMMPYGVGF